jgi:large subunit ribosomal protein L10
LAISRARKEELLDEYRQQTTESNGVLMASYTSLSVQQMQELRRRIHEEQAALYVVKNTLFRIVLEEQGVTVPEELVTGPTLSVFCHEDVPPVAKLLRDYAGSAEEGKFRVKGGYMSGQILSEEDAIAVADMPSREELLAQVLRTINAPATQVVSVLTNGGGKPMVNVVAGGVRQVVNVIQAYVTKLEEAE